MSRTAVCVGCCFLCVVGVSIACEAPSCSSDGSPWAKQINGDQEGLTMLQVKGYKVQSPNAMDAGVNSEPEDIDNGLVLAEMANTIGRSNFAVKGDLVEKLISDENETAPACTAKLYFGGSIVVVLRASTYHLGDLASEQKQPHLRPKLSKVVVSENCQAIVFPGLVYAGNNVTFKAGTHTNIDSQIAFPNSVRLKAVPLSWKPQKDRPIWLKCHTPAEGILYAANQWTNHNGGYPAIDIKCYKGCDGSPRMRGTGTYTSDSSLCGACIHSGRITSKDGGLCTVKRAPGQSSYKGTTKNGIESQDFGKWYRSFVTIQAPKIPDHILKAVWYTCHQAAEGVLYAANQWTNNNGGVKEQIFKCYPGCNGYNQNNAMAMETLKKYAKLPKGTGIYTSDSSMCGACIHSGRITSKDGGYCKVKRAPGQSSYSGTTKNGIESQNFGKWYRSFEVDMEENLNYPVV